MDQPYKSDRWPSNESTNTTYLTKKINSERNKGSGQSTVPTMYGSITWQNTMDQTKSFLESWPHGNFAAIKELLISPALHLHFSNSSNSGQTEAKSDSQNPFLVYSNLFVSSESRNQTQVKIKSTQLSKVDLFFFL